MCWHTRKEFRNIICFALQRSATVNEWPQPRPTCTITQQLSLELCFATSAPVKGILSAFRYGPVCQGIRGRMIEAGYLANRWRWDEKRKWPERKEKYKFKRKIQARDLNNAPSADRLALGNESREQSADLAHDDLVGCRLFQAPANSVKWLPSLKTSLFLSTARKHKSPVVQLRNTKVKSIQLSLEVQDQQYLVALELF